MADQQIDIAKNAKVLEDLKADLVSTVAGLLKSIVRGSQEAILECLAAIIITVYIIGKRLGIKFYQIDQEVHNQLSAAVGNDHDVEKWFKDITSLKEYWNDLK